MKRLLAVLFFIAIFLNSSAYSAFAQTPSPNAQNPIPPRANADVPRDMGTHTQIVLIEIMAAMTCQLAGVDPINPTGQCLGVDQETGKIGYVESGGGLIGVMGKSIAMTYNIPISGQQYIQYMASDFGITKNTYAQTDETSAGFSGLWMLLPVWVQFRNVVYVLFVVIFMLIGIAIVFRYKVDPRTEMTIQSAIPKAIITLVLITFSFAITGFMIDMMYVLMYLLFELVNGIDGVQVGGLSPTNLIGTTPFGAVGALGNIHGLAYHSATGIGGVIDTIVTDMFDFGGGISGWISGNIIGNFFNFLASTITFLIIFIAICFALFRLWFALLKSYVFILIDAVIGPIWIAGSLIPGSPLTAGSWFRHLLKYLLVFPLTLVMFLLGAVFVELFTNAATSSSQFFTPPFIGAPINPKHFGALIGLAIVLMTPEVINMMQSVLKAPENKFQQSIGAAASFGTGTLSKTASPAKSALWRTNEHGKPEGALNFRLAQSLQQRGVQSKTARVINNALFKKDHQQLVHENNERRITREKRNNPVRMRLPRELGLVQENDRLIHNNPAATAEQREEARNRNEHLTAVHDTFIRNRGGTNDVINETIAKRAVEDAEQALKDAKDQLRTASPVDRERLQKLVNVHRDSLKEAELEQDQIKRGIM